MEKSKNQNSIFSGVKTFSEFIETYGNHFEKRKYFTIDEKFEIIKKEPSFIQEMAYIFFQTKSSSIKNQIESRIKEEFFHTYKEKDKKIERMSKFEKEKLKESFKRSIVNKDTIHSIKLGNELFHRDRKVFFEIMYKFSLISSDCNKLVKTFFAEIMLDIDGTFNEIRKYTDEIIKNIINYFVKSESEFIDYSCKNSIEYFVQNKTDLLYKKIYMKKYSEIIEKYNINNIPEIKFQMDKAKTESKTGNSAVVKKNTNTNSKTSNEIDNEEYKKLSESKKILYNYLENE